jgi:hypothetical protein
MVGITVRFMAIGAMHGFSRSEQTKKPLLYVMKKDSHVKRVVISYFVLLAALFAVTTFTFLRATPYDVPEPSKDDFVDKIFENIF